MFQKIVQLALFLIVNAFGFYIVPLLAHTAIKFNWLPDRMLVDDPYAIMQAFSFYLPFWAVAAIASIGFFFTRNELRSWLILAPLYVPALYGAAVLLYFNVV